MKDQLVKYISKNNKKSSYLSSDEITPTEKGSALLTDFLLENN